MNTETTMRWSLHPVDRFDQFAAAWDRLGITPHQLGTIIKQAEPQLEETFSILTEGV